MPTVGTWRVRLRRTWWFRTHCDRSGSAADAEPDLDLVAEADPLGLPDRVLQRQEVGALAGEHRGGELRLPDPCGDRDDAPVGDLGLHLIDRVGGVVRQWD